MIATAGFSPHRKALARVSVIVPTYNASDHWEEFKDALSWQGLAPSQVLIVDSSSTDGTRNLARQEGYHVSCIATEAFNHGATRRAACDYFPWAERLVLMTQDAILASPTAIEDLSSMLDDPEVGAAYGRQLPRDDADPIERHGRLFNYGPVSHVNSFESRKKLGFKAAFFSNSFAVYRRSALEEVGGFPVDVIVSEEVTVVARMLMAGWKVGYCAEAEVYHSHPLSLAQEFSRYFDIGVHHGREKWLLEAFGKVGNEGRRYVVSELKYLAENSPLWIPYASARFLSKFVAYHLGTRQHLLPAALTRRVSGQPNFWNHDATSGDVARESEHVHEGQHIKTSH